MSGWTVAISIASSAMQFMAQQQQQQAQIQQANYRAAVERNNAIIAQQNADAIEKSGEVAKSDRRELIQRHIGTVKAVQAANGFLVDDDEDSTNVLARADVAAVGATDILRLDDRIKDAKRRALIQKDKSTTQAGLFDLKASDSGGLAGVGTLLGGAADTALLIKND